jgi:cytochrome P450
MTSPSADADAADRAGRFRLYDPHIKDAYAELAAFRQHCPVAHSDQHGGHYIFTKFDDVEVGLTDFKHFSSVQTTVPPFEDPAGSQIPLQFDPPEHTLYRQSISSVFSPAYIRRHEPQTKTLAVSLLKHIVERDGGDLVKGFCTPLPVSTFLLILGAPVEDAEHLMAWKNQILHEGFSGDKERRNYVDTQVRPLIAEYFEGLLIERGQQADPPDDVLTTVARGRYGDRPLTLNEQVRMVMLLSTAGADTITNTLSMSLYYLATHPAALRQLRNQPELIPAAVEEFLRYASTVTTARLCVADTSVRGVRIKEGEAVLLSTPSAGRDEDMYPDAEEVRFDRGTRLKHLAFGAGPHRCIGAHMARMEIRVALEALVEIMPEFTLKPGFTPRWFWGVNFGIHELQITSRPTADTCEETL